MKLQKSKKPPRPASTTHPTKAPLPKGPVAKGGRSSKEANENVQEDELLQAIHALGGDEDDYELVKGLDSDDTQEFSDHGTNAKTTKDISNFLKKLNFKEHTAVVPEEEHDSIAEAKESSKKQTKAKTETAASSVQLEESTLVKKHLATVKLNIPASSRWYAVDSPPLRPVANLEGPTELELSSARKKAEALHAALPPPASTSKSDEQFIANVLASGTLSDRLSALTLLAQSSPIHNTRALESLRAMAGKKGREVSLKALRAIVDWWVGGGGPDRKLKYLADQPVNHPDLTDTQLTVWYFEDWLKKYFFNILQLLEGLSLDLLPYVRMQAITLIFQLLDGKPEQEQNLLRLLVNKLGDSEKSVASKASYELLRLLQHHPGMKGIITREISSLILRPAKSTPFGSRSNPSDGVNLHARYYGVITLNQIMLSSSPEDQTVAGLLVDLYFRLFHEILHENARDEKGAAKRAVTNGDGENDAGRDKGENSEPRKEAPLKSLKGSAKGKAPEAAAGDGFTEVEDGDSKTISAILGGVNRAMPFANTDESLFESHIDTLFRITHTATFNVSVQALMLILHVTSSKHSVSDRFYRTLYGSILDSRLANSSKQAMWLNLVFKAIKADTSFNRTCAFVKMILQSLGMHQPPFICGTLYMMGQLMEATPELRELIHAPHPAATAANSRSKKASRKLSPSPEEERYDPRKRDPQYAHAESTCLWELIPLLHHFHPSVSLHARQLLTSAQVTATPDLALNTVSHFLDRFVYKNPKKLKSRGASAMQPAASMGGASGAVRMIRGGISGLGDNVNAESFWKRPVEDVPVDQLFFHKFFVNKLEHQKEKNKKLAKRQKGNDGSDNDAMHDGEDGDDADEVQGTSTASGDRSDADSDEEENSDEDEIWKVMQQTMPGPEADIESTGSMESDDVPSGLDDDESSDPEAEDTEVLEASSGLDEGRDEDAGADEPAEADEDSSDAGVDFAEDDDDLVDSDDEVLIPSAFEPEDSEAVTGKRKPPENAREGGRKKRKIGALPTFASYEDYAKLIEEAPEEDL